jgi:hypothetical protein
MPDSWNTQTRICEGQSPGEILQTVIARFSADPLWWVTANTSGGRYQEAVVFRAVPLQLLLVTGESETASEMRRLLEAGAVAGWGALPIAAGRTPLEELLGSLREMAKNRSANMLARAGFKYVEEVAAVPDGCLRDLRGGGPKFLGEVAGALALLGFPRPGAPSGWQDDTDAGFARGLQALAAWAMAEHGAVSFGDVFRLAFDAGSLPPDIAAEWGQLRCRALN